MVSTAAAALRDGPAEMPEIDPRLRAAADAIAVGQCGAALTLLEPLVGDPALGLHARFVSALAAWRMGQLDGALQLLRQCHDEAPMDGTIAEVLASFYAQIGDLTEALFIGKVATALGGHNDLGALVPENFPSFDRAFLNIEAEPMLARARLNLEAGRLDDAIDFAAQHVALFPTALDARLFYATLLLRRDRASDAEEALRPLAGSVGMPATYHSLYARALAAVGDAERARRHHDRAVADAPDDAEIAAARIVDALWGGMSVPAIAAASADWAARFCPPRKPAAWMRPQDKLVIGYIVAGLSDPLDAPAVAAVAQAHDRSRVTVIGYGRGNLAWPENAVFNGAFDSWQDIAPLDPATLARFFARDGAQVMVDASGFASPRSLQALARLRTAIRVGWLGNPGGMTQPVYDARIAPHSAEAAADKDVWRIAGGYPVLPAEAKLQGMPAAVMFGADVGLAQMDAETLAAWRGILETQPAAKLLLRATQPVPPANVARLVERFGHALAARIDIVLAAQARDFYSGIDIALAPRRGLSARVAAEALAGGVPLVAFAERDGNPYGMVLCDCGLDRRAARTVSDYVAIANDISSSREKRETVPAAPMTAEAPRGDAGSRFADAIERHAMRMLAQFHST